MNNLREVKDDLLKECIEYREETIFAIMNEEDKKHEIRYDEITEKIWKTLKFSSLRSRTLFFFCVVSFCLTFVLQPIATAELLAG